MVDVGRLSLTKIQTVLLIAPPILLVTTYLTYGILEQLHSAIKTQYHKELKK